MFGKMTLAEEEVKKRYKKILIPSLITALLSFVFSITDSYLVSTISQNAVAAIGLVIPIIMISELMFYSIAGSMARNIGQAHGANRQLRITKKIAMGSYLIAFISVLLFLIMFLLKDYIYLLYGAGEDVKVYFEEYYGVWVFTILVSGVGKMYSFSLNAIGEVNRPTKIGIVGMVINLLVSYVLIFGRLGLPEMGIVGAAVGTLIATLITTFLYFYFLNKAGYIEFKIKKVVLWAMFKKARPYIMASMVGGMALPLGLIFMTAMVSHYNNDQIASFTLAHRLDLLWFMVSASAASAFTILGNKAIGAKNIEELNILYRITSRIGLIWAVIILITAIIFGSEIGGLFFNKKETISSFALVLPFTVVIYSFWHTVGMSNSLLSMIGKPYFATSIGVSRVISLYVVMPGIFSYFYGYEGFLWGYALGIVPPFVYSLYLLKTQQNIVKLGEIYWKRNKVD